MRVNITKKLEVKAETWETRRSWGHKAELRLGGEVIATNRIRYYNRTWEPWQYHDVIAGLYEQAKSKRLLSPYYLKKFGEMIDNGGRAEAERVKSQMRATAMVAGLGSILGTSQKESNDWKARMIKAGLPELEMPDDWESLDETEKQTRLDNVIKEMRTI